MKLSVEQPQKADLSVKQDASKIDRNVVLAWLEQDVKWLREKARSDYPGRSMIRVQLLRASIYGCSVLLTGLKDVEIEEILKEIKLIKEKIGLKT